MRKCACWAAAVVLGVATSDAASAGPDECRDAAEQYKTAVSEVTSALQQYATCVTSSDGTDDCSSELRASVQPITTSKQPLHNTQANASHRPFRKSITGSMNFLGRR